MKSLRLILIISCTFIIALGFNNLLTPNARDFNLPRQESRIEATQSPTAIFVVHKTHPKEERTSKRNLKEKLKKARRQIKNKFRASKKQFKKNTKLSKSGKILLSILVVGGSILLLISFAFFCLMIAYANFINAAIATFIIGTILIIWGILYLLKKIKNYDPYY